MLAFQDSSESDAHVPIASRFDPLAPLPAGLPLGVLGE